MLYKIITLLIVLSFNQFAVSDETIKNIEKEYLLIQKRLIKIIVKLIKRNQLKRNIKVTYGN